MVVRPRPLLPPTGPRARAPRTSTPAPPGRPRPRHPDSHARADGGPNRPTVVPPARPCSPPASARTPLARRPWPHHTRGTRRRGAAAPVGCGRFRRGASAVPMRMGGPPAGRRAVGCGPTRVGRVPRPRRPGPLPAPAGSSCARRPWSDPCPPNRSPASAVVSHAQPVAPAAPTVAAPHARAAPRACGRPRRPRAVPAGAGAAPAGCGWLSVSGGRPRRPRAAAALAGAGTASAGVVGPGGAREREAGCSGGGQLLRSRRVAPAATVVARTQPSRTRAVDSHCQPSCSCQKPTWPRSITGRRRSRA